MIHVILLVALIWTLVSVVTYVLIFPLLRAAAPADEPAPFRRPGRRRSGTVVGPDELDRSAHSRVRPLPPGPIEAGYAGLVLHRLTVHTTTVLGATEVCLMAVDDHPTHRLVTVAEQGIGPEAILEAPPPRHRVAWSAVADGGSIAVPLQAALSPQPADIHGTPGRAAITATPIFWQGHVRGVLSAAIPIAAEGNVEARQIRLLEDLGGLVAGALEHQRRRELTSADTGAEIVALVDALAQRDPATRAYGREVVSLARRVGGVLMLDPISAYELELAALLRDVGRLRLPLLPRAASAGSAEHEVGLMHPVWGFEMVAGIPGLEPLAPLVRAHHERWDGLGYPDGLAGTRIPLASRIVAACEAVARSRHGLAEPRATRAAFDELERGAGTCFDPGVVTILERLLSGFPAVGCRSA